MRKRRVNPCLCRINTKPACARSSTAEERMDSFVSLFGFFFSSPSLFPCSNQSPQDRIATSLCNQVSRHDVSTACTISHSKDSRALFCCQDGLVKREGLSLKGQLLGWTRSGGWSRNRLCRWRSSGEMRDRSREMRTTASDRWLIVAFAMFPARV